MEIVRDLTQMKLTGTGSLMFSFPMIDSANRPDYKAGLDFSTFSVIGTIVKEDGSTLLAQMGANQSGVSITEKDTGVYFYKLDYPTFMSAFGGDYSDCRYISFTFNDITGADAQTVIVRNKLYEAPDNNSIIPIEVRRHLKGNTADTGHTITAPIVGPDGKFVSGLTLSPPGDVAYRFAWNDGGQWLSTLLAVGLSEIDNTGVYQIQILNTDNATFQAAYDQTFPIMIKLSPAADDKRFVPLTIAFIDDSLANVDISGLATSAQLTQHDTDIDALINAQTSILSGRFDDVDTDNNNLGLQLNDVEGVVNNINNDIGVVQDLGSGATLALNNVDLAAAAEGVDGFPAYECYRDIKGATGFKFMFPLSAPNVGDADVKVSVSYREDGDSLLTELLLVEDGGGNGNYEFYNAGAVGQYGIAIAWTAMPQTIQDNYNDLESPLQFKIEPLDPGTLNFEPITVIVTDVKTLFGTVQALGSGGAKIGDNLAEIYGASTGSSVGYANGAIWIDSEFGNTNTVPFVDGVADNPVANWVAAQSLASATGLRRFEIAQASNVVFNGNVEKRFLRGVDWNLDPNGVQVDNVFFEGARIQSGIMTGNGGTLILKDCKLSEAGALTIPNGCLLGCKLGGELVFSEADLYVLDQCLSTVAGAGGSPKINVSSAPAGVMINLRHYSGGMEIIGLKDGDKVSVEGFGQIIMTNCTGGSVAVRGNFDKSGNSVDNVTWTETARIGIDAAMQFKYLWLLADDVPAFRSETTGSAPAMNIIGGDAPAINMSVGDGNIAPVVSINQNGSQSAVEVTNTGSGDAVKYNATGAGKDLNAGGIVPVAEGLTAEQYTERLINFFGAKMVRDKDAGTFTFYKLSDPNTISFVMELEKTGVLETRTPV